jgi:hypothetical protein
MNDVSEVRDALEELATSLRSQNLAAEAGQVLALNRTYFTTTTEYLVEALNALDEITTKLPAKQISIDTQRRIDELKIAGRRLANLR